MKFNYGKVFPACLWLFGVSVIWIFHNAFVPLFPANKFLLVPWLIGFFIILAYITALFDPTVEMSVEHQPGEDFEKAFAYPGWGAEAAGAMMD